MPLKNVRYFNFNWSENKKYVEPITRNTEVAASDAESATHAFRNTFGSLNKITLNYLQELDPLTKAPTGSRITPQEGWLI